MFLTSLVNTWKYTLASSGAIHPSASKIFHDKSFPSIDQNRMMTRLGNPGNQTAFCTGHSAFSIIENGSRTVPERGFHPKCDLTNKRPFGTDRTIGGNDSDGHGRSDVNFFKAFEVVRDPWFVCDWKTSNRVFLQVDQSISLESLSFLGPSECESDCLYDVLVDVSFVQNYNTDWIDRIVVKGLYVTPRHIFQVFFDEPIVLNSTNRKHANFDFHEADGYYKITFSLKGPNTMSAIIPTDLRGNKTFNADSHGVGFNCKWEANQLTGLQFKRF